MQKGQSHVWAAGSLLLSGSPTQGIILRLKLALDAETEIMFVNGHMKFGAGSAR